MLHFYIPWKHHQTFRFCNLFSEYKNVTLGKYGLREAKKQLTIIKKRLGYILISKGEKRYNVGNCNWLNWWIFSKDKYSLHRNEITFFFFVGGFCESSNHRESLNRWVFFAVSVFSSCISKNIVRVFNFANFTGIRENLYPRKLVQLQ